MARGDQTTITREGPFVHAYAPTNGASSQRPCVKDPDPHRVPRCRLEFHPAASFPPQRKPRWPQLQERTSIAERAWRVLQGASSCPCRGERKELWSSVVVSAYLYTS